MTGPDASPASDVVWVPGGTFSMGSDVHEPEEAPARRVTVDGFWTQRRLVTNEQFRSFVDATDYVTVAERRSTPPTSRARPPRTCNRGRWCSPRLADRLICAT